MSAISRGPTEANSLLHVDGAVLAENEGETLTSRNPRCFAIGLLFLTLYFDSSVALWQNVYKDAQVARDGPDCSAIHEWITANRAGFPSASASPVALHRSPGSLCPAHILKKEEGEKEEWRWTMITAALRRLARGPTVGFEAENVEKEDKKCSWKAVVHVETGKLNCKPQSFTKGCALSFQALCGLIVYYCYNYYVGGWDLVKQCLKPWLLLKFSCVGFMFGCSAVFAFLAQDALSPGSYALYAQSGVVVVPIIWRVVFRTPLASLTWIHIGVITIGIMAYRISEIELDHMFDGIGLVWVMLKVVVAGLGSVLAELLLKQESTMPFTVQVACILPSKMVACLLTVWMIPGPDWEWPNQLPDRPGGFFHDWTLWTFVIVFHSLGDTILSAAVAKQFDSVVKAICGVVGIIFPTWAVSYMVGWEDLNPLDAAGQLKIAGGIVVIVGSFAYVLGRSQNDRFKQLEAKVAELEARNKKSSYCVEMASGRNSSAIEETRERSRDRSPERSA